MNILNSYIILKLYYLKPIKFKTLFRAIEKYLNFKNAKIHFLKNELYENEYSKHIYVNQN